MAAERPAAARLPPGLHRRNMAVAESVSALELPMKSISGIARLASAMLLAAALAACASTPGKEASDAAQQALYRSHAGAPVRSFHFFGRIDSWTPLDDRTVVVWTRLNEAWLLDLDGPCNGLEYTPAIGLTSSAGTVSARFDKVLVRDPGVVNIPCVIADIRPIDVPALKAAQREAREAKAQASGT
jgi:hypothetical protein